MLLVHDIGQFNAGELVLLHHNIVPFCAHARENKPGREIAGYEFSVCAPLRNTVRVLHFDSDLSTNSKALDIRVRSISQIHCITCETVEFRDKEMTDSSPPSYFVVYTTT